MPCGKSIEGIPGERKVGCMNMLGDCIPSIFPITGILLLYAPDGMAIEGRFPGLEDIIVPLLITGFCIGMAVSFFVNFFLFRIPFEPTKSRLYFSYYIMEARCIPFQRCSKHLRIP